MTTLRPIASLTLAFVLAACAPGAYGGANGGEAGGGPPDCPDVIEIRDFAFDPDGCIVEAGSTVTFVNDDDAPHTATAEAGAPEAFDTGTLQPGDSASVTLDAGGSYAYFCEIHPSMQASIEVVAAGDGAADAGNGDGGADGGASSGSSY